MPDFPLPFTAHRYDALGETLASSNGTTLTASGTVNVKGNFTQLEASTPFNAGGFYLHFRDNDAVAAAHDYLLDVAIGSATNEQLIIQNVLITQATDRQSEGIYFPISIASGSRIAARIQCSVASTTLMVWAGIHSTSFMSTAFYNRVTTYGADTTDSGGTVIDPGGTANTKGNFAQITASTTNPIKYLIMALGNRANGAMAEADFLFDIAIGAAAQEQLVFSNIYVAATIQEIVGPRYTYVPVTIPSGTRIAVRSQSSSIDAADRLLDAVIYGFD